MIKRLCKLLTLLSLIIASCGLYAEQLQIGDSLPRVELLDQHDQSHRLESDIKYLIFAHTKQTGAMMTDILADAEADYLSMRKAVYIADISGMPSLIARLFALPKMRKIASPIYLIREEDQAVWLPRQEDKLTLVALADGLVSKITYPADEETLKSTLELQP
jgi:hypothetical protein